MTTREIEAEPLNAQGPTLTFMWDDETGEIAGSAAERVRQAAEEARERGVIDNQPISSAATEADPLDTAEGLAALLEFDLLHRPPDWLRESLPEPIDGEDTESDVLVLD